MRLADWVGMSRAQASSGEDLSSMIFSRRAAVCAALRAKPCGKRLLGSKFAPDDLLSDTTGESGCKNFLNPVQTKRHKASSSSAYEAQLWL